MTGKVRFDSPQDAHRVLSARAGRERRTKRHDRKPQAVAYRCEDCGGYHLSTTTARRGARRPR